MIIIHCAHTTPDKAPFSYGLLLAYAQSKLSPEYYDLDLRLIENTDDIDRHFVAGAQNIFLCSNYYWSVEDNLHLCDHAKKVNPSCITIHGGPSTPKYPQACEEFFNKNSAVDFSARGEGEILLVELLEAIRNGTQYSTVIEGVSTTIDGKIVHHPDRPLIDDVNIAPSPYLTGIFDSLDPTQWLFPLVQSNRGCAYGCTFCDWPRSRIRKFDLERVYAEIEWAAQRKCKTLYIIDGNFGMLPRDVDIAKAISSAKEKYGFPERFEASYAKQNKQFLIDILVTFAESNLLSHGIVSVQSVDSDTLKAVNRSSIDFKEIEKLSNIFHKQGLKLIYNFMIGLPGSTMESYMNDLRFLYKQNGAPAIHRSVLTPNANMSEPEYKGKYKLECDDNLFIKSTSTMDENQLRTMVSLTAFFYPSHEYYLNMFNYILKYLEHDCGLDVVDTLYTLVTDVFDDKDYPLLSYIANDNTSWLVARSSELYRRYYNNGRWVDLYQEFFTWATNNLDILEVEAFEQVIAAQAASMPVLHKKYPLAIALKNDVANWATNVDAKIGKRLTSYGAAAFTVEEPSVPYLRKIQKSVLRPT